MLLSQCLPMCFMATIHSKKVSFSSLMFIFTNHKYIKHVFSI